MSRRSIKTTAPGEGASPAPATATATASATAQKIPAWLGVGLCLLSYQRNIEFRSKRLRATSCRCGGTAHALDILAQNELAAHIPVRMTLIIIANCWTPLGEE